MQRNDQPISPQTGARVGGALYPIIIVIGIFGEAYVRGALVVPGDAHATTERIIAAQSPWRLLPALIGAGSLCLWLLLKGVNVPQWNARTRAP